MTPYYQEAGITIYHGDCREILQQLGRFDLLLTDPPYGIDRANGMGGGGFDGKTKAYRRTPRAYDGSWDIERPSAETFAQLLKQVDSAVVWGGNYFGDLLPAGNRWLVWDKKQPMPSFSDCEMAWTNLEGNASRMFSLCCSGVLCGGDERLHPTQKPLALIKWCLGFFPNAKSLLDSYCGSGTTLLAAKDMGLSAVGIELEEKYCEIAANRLRQSVLNFEEAV
jgi:DNA modification methylase